MGFGGPGRGRGGPDGQNEDDGPEVPEMNGLTIHGYATTPEAVTALVNSLRASEAFIEGGVYFDEGNVVPVDASQMANPSPPRGGGGGGGFGGGRGRGMDEFGGAGFGPAAGGGGRRGGFQQGGARPQGNQGRVISFRVDVQFKGEPVDLSAPPPGGGGGGMGDPFMGF
jgi:hypothetical protein